MKPHVKPLVLTTSLVILLLLLVAHKPVKAAATNNPIFATIDAVQQMIVTALSPIQTSVQNLTSRVSTLEATVTPMPGQIATLQNKLASDEANISSLQQTVNTLQTLLTPTTTPVPPIGELIFAYNRPASFTTDGTTIPITPNYNWETMTMHVSTTGTLSGYSMIVNLGQGDFEQVRIPCGQQTCQEVTIPLILSDSQGGTISPRAIYKFSTGTSSGNITAIGTLNAEPNSHTLFLGSNLTLPYTSPDLVTSGYSQLEFTVAQANPQNLKSISIQQFDGANWNEIQHISCDGGAACPVQLVSIGSAFHRTRVVIDGSGSNAAVDYLIRP